jgi:hypothetical protein
MADGPVFLRRSRFYTTSFPATENPISEGGRWHHLSATETVVMTENIGGVQVAHGTQTGATGPPYNDSYALLSGFSPNHSIEGVIWKAASITDTFAEVELLLRGTDDGASYDPGGGFGSTVSRYYEVNLAHDGSYLQLGHFKGPNLVNTSVAAPQTGDIFKAQIETSGGNAIISVWINGVQPSGFPYTDTSPFLIGSPGVGFWMSGGAQANNQFGFSSIFATEL